MSGSFNINFVVGGYVFLSYKFCNRTSIQCRTFRETLKNTESLYPKLTEMCTKVLIIPHTIILISLTNVLANLSPVAF